MDTYTRVLVEYQRELKRARLDPANGVNIAAVARRCGTSRQHAHAIVRAGNAAVALLAKSRGRKGRK